MCPSLHTSGEGLHRKPGPCKEGHILQGPTLGPMLQVILFKLGQRKKTLQHSLILDVHLRKTVASLTLMT